MSRENIQEKMKTLFGNSCLGYCYAYIYSGNTETKMLTVAFMNGWLFGYIDDDGYISKPVQYINMLYGHESWRDVEKPEITGLDQLPDDGGLYAVEYQYRGKSHFVVAQKGKVVFDPSYPSNSVRLGKPVSYRKVIRK